MRPSHGPALLEAGRDEAIWTCMPARPLTAEPMDRWLEQATTGSRCRGARYRGRLDHARSRPGGSYRATVIFSVSGREWPAAKASLEDRLRAWLFPPLRTRRPAGFSIPGEFSAAISSGRV